jgi:hypothetical protein
MKVTSLGAWGEGVSVGCSVGDEDVLGELVGERLEDGAGVAASPLSGKPFASTTAPATTRATITTIRAVPRFTGASYPLTSRGMLSYRRTPSRSAVRRRRRASRIRRSLRTSIGSYSSADGVSMIRCSS